MKKMFKLIVVLGMLAGWPLALSAVHVVRTPGQLPMVGSMLPDWGTVHVFTKEQMSFKQTFADTRTWTLEDVAKRPVLVSRMIALGMTSEIAPAGTEDEIVAALKGDIKAKPAVDPWANVPASHVVATPPPTPTKNGKPVELVKPATQPTASQDKSVFGF